jgi:polyferredoxin
MKKFRQILMIFSIVFGICSLVYGAEGQEKTDHSNKFRIEGARLMMMFEPEKWTKGVTPKLKVKAVNAMSGDPILDAEMYVLIEKTKAAMTAEHSMHSMNSPGMRNNSSGSHGGLLDFGDDPDTEMDIDLSRYRRLQPAMMAGDYHVSYPLKKAGEYEFTLAVKSMGAKRYDRPLLYGGKITYPRKYAAQTYRLIFVIGIILVSGIVAVWLIRQRRVISLNPGQHMNLLNIPFLNRFLKSAWFQPLFQVPTFLFFIFLVAIGFADIQIGNRNSATILMWTIWWAAIIFTFVFLGRVWCMMCPFGAIQDWIGKVFSLRKKFPRVLRNIWIPSILFIGITLWDSICEMVNKPSLTSWFLISFFITAVVMSVIFKGRAFCRYVCPIGGVIGLYSMFSPLELRIKCTEVCRNHKNKECIKGTGLGRSCPMYEKVPTLDRNNYCNFCGECIKSCSRDNTVIRFRTFAKDLWTSAKGYLDEAFFAIALVGVTIVVTGEMIKPWHTWMDTIAAVIPYDTIGVTSPTMIEKITTAIVFTVVSVFIVPLCLLITSLIVKSKTGKRNTGKECITTLKETFIRFAYMFIPVGLSMHLAHNISHLFTEGPMVIPAVKRTLNKYAGLNFADINWEIQPLVGNEVIFWLQMLTFIVFNIFSLYIGYRIAVRYYDRDALKAFIPMASLAVLFMVINAFILGQPMALRHTH